MPATCRPSDLVLAAITFGLLTAQVASGQVTGSLWVAVPGAVVLSGSVLARHRQPRAALAVCYLAIEAITLLGVSQQGNYAAILAGFVTLYTLATGAGLLECGIAFGFSLGMVLLAAVPGGGFLKAGLGAFILVGAVVIGRAVGSYRQLSDQLRATVGELEARREEMVEVRVSEEKVAIARELHDVIAHAVSVMVIQATAAEGMLEVDAARARGPLVAVQETGRQALGELRRLLAVLRPEAETGSSLAPQPGLQDLKQVADGLRESGLMVGLQMDGDIGMLPPGVDLAAFRIVQEALTNVVKHAQASRVSVSVRCGPEYVELEIADDGRGPARPLAPGHGLAGMRERVSAYRGDLRAGPGDSGGYRVTARLQVPR
jgi:signal transduction histidine kinase